MQLKKKDTITSLELLEQINFFRKEEGKNEQRHDTLLSVIRDEFEEDIEEQLKEFLFELETNVDDTYIDIDRKMLYFREITDESILKIIKEFKFKEELKEFKEKYCDLLHDLTVVSKFYICQSGADKFGKGVLFLSKLGYEEIKKTRRTNAN